VDVSRCVGNEEGGNGEYLAFSGDGDESAKGREEKSVKMIVLLKSGRGGIVTKPSKYL
jgi:hypothetical protein